MFWMNVCAHAVQMEKIVTHTRSCIHELRMHAMQRIFEASKTKHSRERVSNLTYTTHEKKNVMQAWAKEWGQEIYRISSSLEREFVNSNCHRFRDVNLDKRTCRAVYQEHE